MVGIHFCGCGCQSENPFVCFGAKPTQRVWARDLLRGRKWTREGRSERGQKENSQQKGAKREQKKTRRDTSRAEKNTVGRREQSAEGHSQQKGAEETSRQRRSVKRWESGREETSQQKSERRLLGPVDVHRPGWTTREDESTFLVVLWNFTQIHARDSLQIHEELPKGVTDLPLLHLE